jgi:hypothetical protein
MIRIELSQEDVAFLRDQLALRERATQNELVHTDDRTMRADIVRDLERLQRLQAQVSRTLTS